MKLVEIVDVKVADFETLYLFGIEMKVGVRVKGV